MSEPAGKSVSSSTSSFEQELDSLLDADFDRNLESAGRIMPRHRIFSNRQLDFKYLDAIGFDLDFTLLLYNQKALDALTVSLTLKTLTERNAYPDSIHQIQYDPKFSMRGLSIDTELGNIIKLDKFQVVGRAIHGLKPLDAQQLYQAYGGYRVDLTSPRYIAVDTLFELVETYLFAALVEHLELEKGQDLDFRKLFTDIRSAVDLAHRDGSLKSRIVADPQAYIHLDPGLVPSLYKFKRAGKRLFIVSNSEAGYAVPMLDYLFKSDTKLFAGGWRDCFELVYTSAAKPLFFESDQALRVLAQGQSVLISGGNREDLERRLGCSGDRILFVGDHIYGDIVVSKKRSAWRVCMIVPELPGELSGDRRSCASRQNLAEIYQRLVDLEMKYHFLASQLEALRALVDGAEKPSEIQLKKASRAEKQILNQQQLIKMALGKIHSEIPAIEESVRWDYNPHWGALFRTGKVSSMFAEQIRDYACIYTSAVSNFYYYSSNHFFDGFAAAMPHESYASD